MFCPKCGKELLEDQSQCVECTETVETVVITPENTPAPSKKSLVLVLAPAVALVFVVLLIVLYAGVGIWQFRTDVPIDVVPANIEENEPTDAATKFPGIWDGQQPQVQSESGGYDHVLQADANNYSGYYKNLIQQDGVTWSDTPTPFGDLKLFSMSSPYPGSDFEYQYWQIGTYQNQPIFMVLIPCTEMCFRYAGDPLFFYGSAANGYHLISSESEKTLGYYKDGSYALTFSPQVIKDDSLVLQALNLDETLVVNGVDLKLTQGEDFYANTIMNSFTEGARNYKPEFVTDTKYGPLFRAFHEYTDDTVRLDYGIRLAGGLHASIDINPTFIWDDRVPRIGWLNGNNNEAAYRTDGIGGCGGGGPEIVSVPIPEGDITLTGHTIANEPIYTVTNPNNPLIARNFDNNSNTKFYYEYNETTSETETKEITRDQFIKENGVIIYKDPFGFQHVLTHTKYGPQAECGKPVIYLYPKTPTDISVGVDALITKSEPKYDNGWRVHADPSGSLVVNGQTYDSLYWDGYGNGDYPVLTKGFVVPTSEAMALMETHLHTMNFNEKEIADFVEFWEPNLPSEPYTRFSWIGTRDMEQLAKLTIDPKPDTLIRAFIDFEGVAEPEEIAPQEIPTYSRDGYVVTEWGGLLRR